MLAPAQAQAPRRRTPAARLPVEASAGVGRYSPERPPRRADLGRDRGGAATPSGDFARQLADLSQRLATISQQNSELLAELRSLRQENIDLRRQLDAARPVALGPALHGALGAAPPEVGDGDDMVMECGTPERPRGAGGRRSLSLGPHTAHGF